MREPGSGAAERSTGGRGVAALWAGVLGGPAVWFLHLVVSYSLVRYVCFTGAMWLMHLTTVVGLVAVGGVTWLAWSNWGYAGRPRNGRGGGTEGRTRFMALLGVPFAIFSLLLIVVQGISNFVIEPCI